MSIDRDLWRKKFNAKNFPAWICPNCFKGLLRPDKNKFIYEETFESKKNQNHQAWEPDWTDLKCSGILKCSNPDCRELVTIVGTGSFEEFLGYDLNGNTLHDFIEKFTPIFFYPPLFPFQLPEKCPKEIKAILIDSFKLFLFDHDSAGNKIRITVESLLTEQRIPKSKINNKKRVMRSLHNRIELYKKKNPEISEMLMAIKWLGNIGSHEGKKLNLKKILDAYEIIEHILEKLYSKKEQRVTQLVRKINKNKK